MDSATVAALTQSLRNNSIRSEQYENAPGSGQWFVVADSAVPYTMAQLANLEATHTVGAVTDRAEFGPGTAAQIADLEAALRTARVAYQTSEKVANSDQWYCLAVSGAERTVAQVQALEAAHGLVATTTRARFS